MHRQSGIRGNHFFMGSPAKCLPSSTAMGATFDPALVEEVAPTPKEPTTLSPKQLKKALLGLSTPGALTDLPKDTVNLLIFNNATA